MPPESAGDGQHQTKGEKKRVVLSPASSSFRTVQLAHESHEGGTIDPSGLRAKAAVPPPPPPAT
eukprot:4272431-Alexandrium_andersonii.AAC.1